MLFILVIKNIGPLIKFNFLFLSHRQFTKINYMICVTLCLTATCFTNGLWLLSACLYLIINGTLHTRKMLHVLIRYVLHVYVQGVPGGMCQTSGECSLS